MQVHPLHQSDLFLGVFPRADFVKKLQKVHPHISLDLCPDPTAMSLIVSRQCGREFEGRWLDRRGTLFITSWWNPDPENLWTGIALCCVPDLTFSHVQQYHLDFFTLR